MKKTLFMCALGLTIATSMVAGTMAVYTHADTLLAENASSATAKKFYVGGAIKTYSTDIKLAPGQSEEWTFTATNIDPDSAIQSEVLTDLEVSISGGDIINWDELIISVKDENGNTYDCDKNDANRTVSLPAQFQPNTAETKNYTLTFTWDDTNNADGSDEYQADLVMGNKDNDMPRVSGLNVTLRGVQNDQDTPTSSPANAQ